MSECIYHYRIIRGVSSPIIPVTMMKGDNTARIYAYVDSGATYSVFSADDAEKIGIDMERREPRYLDLSA